jgi:hypothetical protein
MQDVQWEEWAKGRDVLSRADMLGLNSPEWGEVPCTIRLQPVDNHDENGVSHNEKQRRSITILNEGPFDHTHDVYGAQDDFARRLLEYACSPGGTFRVRRSPGEPEREYRIAEVLSPYVHAFQETVLRGAEWFGDAAGVWSINVKDGFDQFFAMMDALGQGFYEVMEFYAEWGFPLCSVANVRSRSVFDLWFLVAQAPRWGIHAERGGTDVFGEVVEQLEAHFDAAREGKPTLVLESTALLALVHLGLAGIITPHFRLLVPQSLRRKVKLEAGEAHAPHIPTGIFHRLLEFIDERAETLSVASVIEFSPQDIQQWERCIGREELDALLLAREHSALVLSDDAVLREAGRFQHQAESVNTQHVLAFLERRGFLSQEARYECLEKMAQHNFKHVLLSAHFFLWLLEKHANKAAASVRAAFRYLEAPMCNEENALVIAATLIGKVYSLPEPQPFDVLDLCLLALATGRPIASTLEKLQRLLRDPHFGLQENMGMLRTVPYHIEVWKLKMLRDL